MILVPPSALLIRDISWAYSWKYDFEGASRIYNRYLENQCVPLVEDSLIVIDYPSVVLAAMYLGIKEIWCREFYHDATDHASLSSVR